jgi:hypothetical protein
MTELEEYLRIELHALVDDEQAPDVLAGVRAAAVRRRRLRMSGAIGTTGVVVATILLILTTGIGAGGHAPPPTKKPVVPPSVTSYFRSQRPPLPARVVVRPVSAGGKHVLPRDSVIAAWRAYWADPRYRNAKGTPTDRIGVLRTADLVVASTPGYPRPYGLSPVHNRLAWMLVSTDYTYRYQPYLPGCSVKSWWEQHKAQCASPPPMQTHTGARFDFIDAITGAGLVAIGTDNHDPTFATTVAAYTKTLPPPPAGARTLTGGQPTLQSNQVIGPAPKNSKPNITAQQAIDTYKHSGAAASDGKPPTAKLVMLYQLLAPNGDADFQDASWHANLVWLVTVTGIRSVPMAPANAVGKNGCVGSFPVDANTGKAYWFDEDCPGKTGTGVPPIHR